ncbi:MAG: hypothetical protein E4G91_08600 [Candidatus Zixiibacteriota bacterium]|nr:MAG: hypothetical protein E4G91_08600 [candidate division Zixibacteria bacterium]
MGRNRPLAFTSCFLLLLSVLPTTRSLEAGEGTFKIPDYIPQKFTDLRLQVSGGANSSNQNSSDSSVRESQTGSVLPVTGDGKSDSHYHYFNLGSSGEYRYETVPFRLRCGADVTTSLNYSKNNVEDHDWGEYYDRRSTSDNSYHIYAISARPFFSGLKYVMRDFFVITDNHLGLSYNHAPGNRHGILYEARHSSDDSLSMETQLSSYSYRWKYRQFTFSADVGGAFGFGHVYEGWYAATSLYIIEELRSKSLLETEPTIQQMKELSALVYQNALQHAIDNRIRLIESMQAILDYLEQQGILKQGFSSTLIVQDVWNYFPRTSRRFGWQVSIGCGLTDNYLRNNDSSFNVTTRINTRYLIENPSVVDTITSEHNEVVSRSDATEHYSFPYMQLQADCHRAIDLRWQFDTDLAGRYYFHTYRKSEYGGRTDYDDYVSLDGEATLTYIMNSRTSAALRGQLTYESYKLTTTEGAGSGSQERSLDRHQYGVSLEMTYRVSIPTTLRFALEYSNHRYPQSGMTYMYQSSSESYNARISISHYLF